ncbi:MAG: hypothetical protein L6R40_006052 [Gallowayella cf. fulva]|nr:MAG: hypothetical protein L6R40_006052 [Xanthomendoza cf. fulva]
MSKPTPKSGFSPIRLTFGVELEHILAFHSSLLIPLLPPNTRIIKDIPEYERERLRQTTTQYYRTRWQYHGWAVTAPSTYPSPFGGDWHNQCIKDHRYRGYADEVLRIEKEIFTSRGKETVVHDGRGKMHEFGKWYLTTDTSLVGATPKELALIIGEKTVGSREWDSGPVELVSRVLDIDDDSSYQEIWEMLEILKAGDGAERGYRTFADQWCGLHVHIGLPPGPAPSTTRMDNKDDTSDTLPLLLLQHLAYITTIYEPALSLLHPPKRRPGHPNARTDLLTNREGFEERDYSTIDWDSVSDSGNHLQEPPPRRERQGREPTSRGQEEEGGI